MKLGLNIVLELPDEFAHFSQAELRQAVFDNYINFVQGEHATHVIHWMSEQPKDDRERVNYPLMAADHKKWSEIAKTAQWTMTVVGVGHEHIAGNLSTKATSDNQSTIDDPQALKIKHGELEFYVDGEPFTFFGRLTNQEIALFYNKLACSLSIIDDFGCGKFERAFPHGTHYAECLIQKGCTISLALKDGRVIVNGHAADLSWVESHTDGTIVVGQLLSEHNNGGYEHIRQYGFASPSLSQGTVLHHPEFGEVTLRADAERLWHYTCNDPAYPDTYGIDFEKLSVIRKVMHEDLVDAPDAANEVVAPRM